jgi:ACS family allantoate permease-like MFS transporter
MFSNHSQKIVAADKSSIASQATFGLRKDTHLVGQQFAWLSTIFYLAYPFFEGPANYLMQRTHIGRTVGIFAICWGACVLSIAFCKDFTQLAAVRFLQGAFECSITPAFLLITSSFYPTRELPLRVIIWGTGSTSFGIISDLSLYGIGRAATKSNLIAPWRGISFFLGGLTILVGITCFLLLGTAREVPWLSEDEKRRVHARTVENHTGTDREKRVAFDWAQARECLTDPQIYFLFFAQLVNSAPNSGINTFGNLVYTSFGFSPLDTLLKGTVPRNAFAFSLFLCLGFLMLKRANTRFTIMIVCIIPAIIAFFLLAFLPNSSHLLWAKWGFFFMSATSLVSGPLLQTFSTTNVAGRTKRTVTLTAVFIAYFAGSAAGAQIFQADDAPRYHRAIAIISCLYALELTIMLAWRTYYVIENRKRNKAQAAAGISEEERLRLGGINAELGMTDRSKFLYLLLLALCNIFCTEH